MKSQSDNTFSPLNGFEQLVASTQCLIREVFERGGNVTVLDDYFNLIEIEINRKKRQVLGTTYTHTHSLLNHMICEHKDLNKKLLRHYGFDTPNWLLYKSELSEEDLQLNFPLVVKPTNANHGKSIVTGISNQEELFNAIETVREKFDRVLIEEQVEGQEYRFLVIDKKLIGVINRVPPNVVGNGIDSIKTLVEEKNRNRGVDYRYPLIKIPDSIIEIYLKEHKQDWSFVPQRNQQIQFEKVSNLSHGGDSIDVTDDISDFHKSLALEVCNSFNLPLAGIDIIIPDLSKKDYTILEINERPMISMHSFPYKGKNRKAEVALLNHLMENE